MRLIHAILCRLGYHPYIYPAFSDVLRFCPYCNEWDHRVEQVGGGMRWVRMVSIHDFQDHTKPGGQ